MEKVQLKKKKPDGKVVLICNKENCWALKPYKDISVTILFFFGKVQSQKVKKYKSHKKKGEKLKKLKLQYK